MFDFFLFPVVKNFENRLRFYKVTAMSLVSPFWGTAYIEKLSLKDKLGNYSIRHGDDNMWTANFGGGGLRSASADVCK